jgi:hypothetical protein
MVDVAIQGLVHSIDELCHGTKSPPQVLQNSWDDFLRVAGSIKMGKVSASELIRTLQQGSKRSLVNSRSKLPTRSAAFVTFAKTFVHRVAGAGHSGRHRRNADNNSLHSVTLPS